MIKDAAYKAAAIRLFPKGDVPLGGAVGRVAGGAFVEIVVFVPNYEAERDAEEQADEERLRAARAVEAARVVDLRILGLKMVQAIHQKSARSRTTEDACAG
jgi:hypothetical protein